MKTAGLTTMLSTVLLLLASLAAEGSALALRPYMFGEGLAEGEQGAADDSQYSQRQRDTRAVQPDIQTVSDYAITVLEHRQSWKNSNCQTTFNCATVSSQHCGDSNNELIFFSPNKSSIQTNYGCELDFKIAIDMGGTAEGLEFALYKKSEPNADKHLAYYTYIIYKPQNETSFSSVAADRLIMASCSSWQVFDISSIKNKFPPGVHEITMLVAIFKGSTDINFEEQPVHMNCEEIRSLFVMDSDADINQFISQPDPPVQLGSKTERSVAEENLSSVDEKQKQNEENNNQTQEEIVEPNKKEEGSGKEAEEVQEAIEVEYLPSLSVYVSGTQTSLLSKRSVAEMTSSEQVFTEVINGQDDDHDQASGGNECKRIENKIFMPEYFDGILQPQIVDVGQCLNSTDSSIECKPSKYRTLEILRKVDNRPKIQTIKNLIIAECSSSMYNNNPHDQPISVA